MTPEEQAAAESATAPRVAGREDSSGQNSQKDLFNAWMRQQPWYQQWFKAKGLDPNRVKLSDSQRDELQTVLAQHGYDLSKSDGMNIDPAGNLNDPHGFSSQPTWLKAIEIGGAAVGAGMGAGALLGASAPAGIGTTDVAGTVGAGLPAVPTVAGAGGSTLGTIGGLLSKGGLGTAAGLAGRAVGAATSAAGQTQLENAKLGLEANQQDISGQSQFQNEQQNMAKTEASQRDEARKDLYRASAAQNPSVGPSNTRGVPALSADYMSGLTDLEKQALKRLQDDPQYGTNKMVAPTPYQPYKPKTDQSTLQQVGNWLSPTLSTIGALGKYL